MNNHFNLPKQSHVVTRNRTGSVFAERVRDLSSIAIFVSELIANPRSMGAAIPSSRALARQMASFIPHQPKGYVVELGPGTGVITSALLNRGIRPEKLILIERSLEMVKMLKKRYPGVKVVHGDAAHLSRILSQHTDWVNEGIDYVVSSLPLRSLPKSVVEAITHELCLVLTEPGRFIQYTYDLRRTSLPALKRFNRFASRMVWFNVPPARVDVFNVATQ